MFSVPSPGSRSQDSNTKMPWWHPGWTRLLSLQTVKTLKLNWLLRSCTTGCRMRRPTCSTNRTVWRTPRPTTACTAKAPSRAPGPHTRPLASRLPTVNPTSVSLCAMLHPATSWHQRLCPLPGSSRGGQGGQAWKPETGSRQPGHGISRLWRWTSSAQIESCLFFQLYLLSLFTLLLPRFAWSWKLSQFIFFREIMFLKSVFCRVLSCSVWTLLWPHDVTLRGWTCPSSGLPWALPPHGPREGHPSSVPQWVSLSNLKDEWHRPARDPQLPLWAQC